MTSKYLLGFWRYELSIVILRNIKDKFITVIVLQDAHHLHPTVANTRRSCTTHDMPERPEASEKMWWWREVV
jgi:hypothetical protein